MPRAVKLCATVCSAVILIACGTTSKPLPPLSYPTGKAPRIWINANRAPLPNEIAFTTPGRGIPVTPAPPTGNSTTSLAEEKSNQLGPPTPTSAAKTQSANTTNAASAVIVQKLATPILPLASEISPLPLAAKATASESAPVGTKTTEIAAFNWMVFKGADIKETVSLLIKEFGWQVEWSAPEQVIAETQKFSAKTGEGVLALVLRKLGLTADKYNEDKTYAITSKK